MSIQLISIIFMNTDVDYEINIYYKYIDYINVDL